MSATWDEFTGCEPAEIRRRQLRGQEVAELRVSALGSFHDDDEPLSLPMRRFGWTWAALGGAVAAAVAIFALARTPNEETRSEPAPKVVAARVVVPPPEAVVTAPAVVTPPKPKARARH